jgi:hypothetical protein
VPDDACLVCFSDRGTSPAPAWFRPLQRCLRPGYRHVSLLWSVAPNCWVWVDPTWCRVGVQVLHGERDMMLGQISPSEVIARHWPAQDALLGHVPMVMGCVSVAKAVLGIRAPGVWTPWQLRQWLVARGGK